jgi:PAS domain S-box-containing protein
VAGLIFPTEVTRGAIDPRQFKRILFRSLAIPFAISIVIGIAAVLQVNQLLNAAHWVDHSDAVIAQVREVERYTNAIESGTRGFLLTGDPSFVKPSVSAVENIPSSFAQLGAMVSDNPVQVNRVRDLKILYTGWLDYMTALVRLKKEGADFVGIMRTGRGEDLTARLRQLTQDMVVDEGALRTKREQRVHRFSVSSVSTAGTLFLLFLIASAISGRRQIGELSGVYGATLDNLERSHADLERKVEERTRELREKNRQLMLFRLLAEGVRDYGIIFLDPRGYITTWTASAERLYGYTAKEIVGKHFSTFYSQEELKTGGLEQDLDQAVQLGRFEGSGWRVRKNGEHFWANAVLTPIYEDGNLVGFGKISRDITEQKRLKDAQEVANRELEAFSYSVSHDLRAPLRGIDGFSKAILEDYGSSLDATARSYLDRVRAATQRMGRLIDDMLALSRVTRTETRPEPLNLSQLVEGIVADLRASDPERKIEVVIEPDVEAIGDPGLLRIGLENLISNAWKFTARQTDARIEFGRLSNSNGGIYFVRDNGAGFDMTYADKLFGAFQRLHRADEFPGTGVGLATVRRIITKHGGRVWADSKPGAGATFYFTLSEEKIHSQAA